MKDELAWALITPYSLSKSRTGGIIGRIISQTELDFVGARMYLPSDEFADRMIDICQKSAIKEPYKSAFSEYIDHNLKQSDAAKHGITNRCMLLLFRGPNAVKTLRETIGSPTPKPVGNTVRATYGDCIFNGRKIEYFEPAVLTASDADVNRKVLKLLSTYAEKDGGVLKANFPWPKNAKLETTLVMLKPDNFYKRSSRPGNIIDMFSKTGMRIIGARLFSMNLNQAMEFYGFLEDVFVKKLDFMVENGLRNSLHGTFDFDVTMDDIEAMSKILVRKNAHCEVCKIIEFMTGKHPDHTPKKDWKKSGDTKCLALLYRGPNAIQRIRDRLGSTDPTKALGGTVRNDYGRDLMRNGAHASDSLNSAYRERPIVGLVGGEKSDEKTLINRYLKELKKR
ncbi:MAG: nucleoside-diphosphate kinase [Planctomycetota bacterium]|jgi:nucleoside diphosphate kinase